MTTSITVPVRRLTPTGETGANRAIPIEAPIAIEYNGIGYAVMMATPDNLDDFAIGFSLSERIVEKAADIQDIAPHETPQGWVLRIRIAQDRVAPMLERVRVRVSESSCGLCGMENLEQIARALPPLQSSLTLEKEAIFKSLEALSSHQSLNRETGGAHAAAFCSPDGAVLMVREDVGRHCALDKLIGALARDGLSPTTGYFLLTSRCSYELVEKTVIVRCPALVTISTATSLAIERAQQAGLALTIIARPDAVLAVQ